MGSTVDDSYTVDQVQLIYVINNATRVSKATIVDHSTANVPLSWD